MSMVFPKFWSISTSNNFRNTEYGLEVQNVPKEERRKRAEKALDNANLLDLKISILNNYLVGCNNGLGLRVP